MGEAKRRVLRDYRMAPTNCVNCGKELDAAASVDTGEVRPPRPGDLTVCMDCRHLMVFGDDMKFRNPTEKEMIEIAGNQEMVTAMKMLHWADRFRSTEPKG